MNARNALLTISLAAALVGCSQAPRAAYLPSPAQTDGLPAPVRPAGARALRIYYAGYDASNQSFGVSELGVFAASATGNAGAINVIKGSSTHLASPEIAILDHSGRIWTCNFNGDNVEAFAPGATGNVAPVVDIVGSKVGLNACGGMTLGKNGSIVATSFGSVPSGAPPGVLVWPAGSNGNAGPHAVYSGSNTGLIDPNETALDAAGRIYVGNALKVDIFGSNFGNVAPLYSIAGSATGLKYPDALAIDPATQNLLVADEESNAIKVFKAGAHGNVAAIETITGNNTLLNNPYGVAIDPAGYIYVGNCPQKTPYIGSIEVFAPGANGNVKPVQRIIGSNANISCVGGLTVL